MKTNRKTIKMPVRYLMNLVLVALLFVVLSLCIGHSNVHNNFSILN